jgi:long-chain fatty acid transport protein
VNLAFRGAKYSHAPIQTCNPQNPKHPCDYPEPSGAQGANTDEASLFNVIASPMLGASVKLGDFAIGAGAYVPFGGTGKWDKNEKFENQKQYPGIVDGAQRWYAIEGTIRALYFTLAAAYKIPGTGLSLGVAGNLIRAEIHTIRARNAAGTNNIHTSTEDEGRSLADVGDWAGGFAVGAMFEALPKKLWLGASYQSRPNVSGGMSLDGQLTNNFGRAEEPVPIDISQDWPDVYRLGVKFKPSETIELRLFGDFTRWSSLENQCLNNKDLPCDVDENGVSSGADAASGRPLQNLNRNWDDTFGVRAGASVWVAPPVEVFTGLGYDGNAVPDETMDPSLTDFHDISVALGARFELVKQLHAAISYTHFFYFSRDTSGKSKNDNFTEEQSYSRSPDAGGTYSQWVGVVNVNLEANF